MSALASVFGGRSDLTNPTKWLLDGLSLGRKTHSGQTVSPERAMTLPAYYAVIRVISEDVGKTPFSVIREAGNDRETLTDHPLQQILQVAPNPDMVPLTFFELGTQYAASWGNGVSEIEWDARGRPVAFHPIHPSRLTIQREESGAIVYDVWMEGGTVVRLASEDVLHIRGFGDGISGYSLARYAAESIGLGLAAQQFGAAFFGNGARTDVVITHPKALSADAHNRLRDSWTKAFGGSNAFTPAILEEGMTVEKLSIPPEEAQFLETRKLQAVDICSIARVDPCKIQHLEHVKFNNYEALAINHVNDCLTPWVKRWEQEFKRKLLANEKGVRVKADFRSQLRGDHSTRAQYYDTLTRIGVLNRNEVRALEDMPSIGPDGDKFTLPLNIGPADSVANGDNSSRKQSDGVDNNSRPIVPAVEPDDDDTEDDSNARAKAAQRRVFIGVIDGLMRKERNAITRLLGKAHTDESYNAAVAKFGVEHRAHAADAIRPSVEALAEWLKADEPVAAADTACRMWVDTYMEIYYQDCKAALASGKYEIDNRCDAASKALINMLDAVIAATKRGTHAAVA